MVKVKFCGNQSSEDIIATSGADAQGFIVMANSNRELDVETAALLMGQVPLFNAAVLVTMMTDPLWVSDLVEMLEPNAVQVHAELTPLQIDRIRRAIGPNLPFYAVLGIDDEQPEQSREQAHRLADTALDGLLLDSRVAGQMGGTGQPHRWDISARIVEDLTSFPIILAGGLTPENVAEAIDIVNPYAVDVSSGIETDGKKDFEKASLFLERVKYS